MRTIKQLPEGTSIEENLELFPQSTIVNQTPTKRGTPVVREIYGDPLTNIYAILKEAGLEPNNLEDNEENGYQLLEAIKNLPNKLNDIERVLNKNSNIFSVDLKLSLLPNNYFFIAKSAEEYLGEVSFFKGTENTLIPFECLTGFSSNDELIIIINSEKVRAYKISGSNSATSTSEVFNVLGTPLPFSDSGKIWYSDNGKLYNDAPLSVDLKLFAATKIGNPNVEVYEVFIVRNYVIYLVFSKENFKYYFFKCPLNNLVSGSLEAVEMSGKTFGESSDFKPFVYSDGKFVYITNGTNQNASDNVLDVFDIEYQSMSLKYSSTVTIDNLFLKSTNTVILNGKLFQLISGDLRRFPLSSDNSNQLAIIEAFVGVIFSFRNKCFYTNGEVAKNWTLV